MISKISKLVEKLKVRLSPHKCYIRKHLNEFLSLIIKSNNSPKVIIDVGAGTSPYKNIFDPIASNYISIDMTYYPNLSIIGIAQKLPFKSHIADIVLLIEVLEHIYETQETLNEINRILKPNGYLVLTVPFIIGYHTSIDYFRFTEDALRRLLKDSGFEIISLKKRGGILTTLVSILINVPSSLFKDKKLLYLLFLILLAPLIIIGLLLAEYLDVFDENKRFTIGYDLLALKIKDIT